MRFPLVVPASRAVDVVAFGENSLDLVGVTAAPVVSGAKLALDVLQPLVGGQAATAAVGCARQGLRVRYAGAFGSDEAADRVRAALTADGVDVVSYTCRGAATRTAIVLVARDSGERTVLERRDPALVVDPDRFDLDALVAGRVLMVDAAHPAAATAAARRARAAGIPTVVDIDRVGEDSDALLAEIDMLIVPASFARAWSGEASASAGLARLVEAFHPALAVVTLGDEGALAVADGRELRVPAFSVPVVDTTGAGDAFRAGFVSAWLRLGDTADLERLLRFASATAALNCGALGAQTGLPDLTSLEAFVTTAAWRRSI